MSKTINDYAKPTGTEQEILDWWNEYTRNLSTEAAIDAIEYKNSIWNNDKIFPLRDYEATEVNSNGGYEGAGEDMDITFMIHKVSNVKDVLGYIQFTGRYSSWDSSEWYDSPSVVKPIEVTMVEFR